MTYLWGVWGDQLLAEGKIGMIAKAVEAAKISLAANEERAKIAEAQYSTGFITYDNWSIIDNNLVQSKKSYLNAQAGALLAEAQWVSAKGVTLEYANQ